MALPHDSCSREYLETKRFNKKFPDYSIEKIASRFSFFVSDREYPLAKLVESDRVELDKDKMGLFISIPETNYFVSENREESLFLKLIPYIDKDEYIMDNLVGVTWSCEYIKSVPKVRKKEYQKEHFSIEAISLINNMFN